MHEFLVNLRGSIALRIFLRKLVAGLGVTVLIGTMVQFYMKANVDREIRQRADSLIQSLEIFNGVNGRSSTLARDVDAIGHEPNVAAVIVGMAQHGDQPVIVAASDNSLLGQRVDQIPDAALRDSMISVSASRQALQQNPDNEHYRTIQPLSILARDFKHAEQGVVDLEIDTAAYYAELRQDLASMYVLLAAAILLQIILGHGLEWHSVFLPIAAIKVTMQKRAAGDPNAYAPVLHKDEIGEVAKALNDMLDAMSLSENQLHNTTENMELVLDCIREGIYGVDLNGCTTFGNKSAEHMLGYGLDEMLHRPQHDLIHHHFPDGTSYPKEQCKIYQAFRHGQTSQETREVFWRKDGTSFPVEYNASPKRDKDGAITGAVVVFRDITERQQTEQTMHEYARQLEQKTRELEAANAVADLANDMKDEFLANMSHEIRTPMNGIIGMTELLLETPLAARQKHFAETVLHSAESLLRLINDILDLSKVESGKMELEPVIFDMSKLAHEIVDLFSIKAQEKSIALTLAYAPEAARYIVGDPVRVRQLLSNLISNAIKFTPAGQVSVNVGIDSGAVEESGTAAFRIEVSDTGIGIAEEAQKRIFDKFTQADASTTRKYGGTGLGLAICKQLVGLMGGEIGVTSQLDAGSTFRVTLKLRRAAPPLETDMDHQDESARNLAWGGAHFQNVHILLAEDNPVDREFGLNMLRGFGCRVTVAENGEEVLDKVAADRCDLILMDCEMPQMSGYRAARLLNVQKNAGQLPDIPIVAVLSSDEAEVRSRCLISGMIDFLTKPLRKEALAQMLLTWLPKSALAETVRQNQQACLIGQHVLLVEDSAVNQIFIAEVLRQSGCRVTLAENGREALLAVEAHADIDIVLMDGHMPVMDGFAATKALREAQRCGIMQPIPIIALTALAMSGDRERCREAGMDDYLPKPVRKEELVAMLLKWRGEPRSGKKVSAGPALTRRVLSTISIDHETNADVRTVLGLKYQNFVRAYLDDTVTRLQQIGAILAAGGDRRMIGLHAHSIHSSSASIGALNLSDYASALELKMGEAGIDFETTRTLYEAMQGSFVETRQAFLEEDQRNGLMTALPRNTAATVPATEAVT